MNIQRLPGMHVPLRHLILLGFAPLFLFGCAATGPKFQEVTKLNSDSAEIVVYRPDRFVRGGVSYYVNLDGSEVATLRNAGFVSLPTAAGTHVLQLKAGFMGSFKPITTEVTLAAGERKFFRFEPSLGGIPIVLPGTVYVPVAYGFGLVAEDQAVSELKELKRSE